MSNLEEKYFEEAEVHTQLALISNYLFVIVFLTIHPSEIHFYSINRTIKISSYVRIDRLVILLFI